MERVAKEIMNLDSELVLKDDQEPSIKALREAVIRRITALKGDLDIRLFQRNLSGGKVKAMGRWKAR